jgi:sigma-B regulation protein RsbU (phosphoserine phosphatase)
MYATLFLGIFDPKTRLLRYVNAGHHPQFALCANGTLESLSSTGLPIGLLAGRGYIERTVELTAGDLIVFYTDGVVETENEQEDMFGAERFETLLSSLAGRTSGEVLREVERELKTYRGTREPYDDATLMVVSVG